MPHATPQEPTLGLDTNVFMDVIATGDAARRSLLASQIAAFLADENNRPSEREQVVPVALKLAADVDIAVRRALAEGLVNLPNLHADLLFAIVSDEDEIALPFLAETKSLNHWHMLAVLRVGDMARQATVALRPDVSAEAVTYITRELALPVNALLLDNAAARLSAADFEAVFERFGDTKEILEALMARPDLPPAIRILQARRSAANLQALLLERGWIPANDAAELVADAEEGAVLQVLANAGPERLAGVTAFLIERELLTPSIIVRAACNGAMEIVEHCLAGLAALPLRRARGLIYGGASFKTLHDRSGLPPSCYWVLQAACDVARESREDGLRLPPEDFGRRLIEMLMTRYEALPMSDRPRHLDYISRFAAERTRRIARRLKADLVRAA